MRERGSAAVWIGVAAVALCLGVGWVATRGRAAVRPELAKPRGERCVEPRAVMAAEHPVMLGRWRDAVVRDAQREYVSSTGEHFEMSLTRTCIRCHGPRDEFCGRCHEFANVDENCWECHVDRTSD
jgi:hypothetical protein